MNVDDGRHIKSLSIVGYEDNQVEMELIKLGRR